MAFLDFIGNMFSNPYDKLTQQSQQALLQQNQNAQATTAQAQGMLTNLANGTGPNPALAQLQQSTNATNQQAAGTIASAKGVNPALAARAGMLQSANNNQNAAGQAAQQTATQQLGAQQALANLGLQQQSLAQGAIAQQNQATGALAAGDQKNGAGIFGGILSGAAALLNKGGMVPHFADGGQMPTTPISINMPPSGAPSLSQGLGTSAGLAFLRGAGKGLADDSQLSKGTSSLVSGIAGKLKGAFAGSPMTDAGLGTEAPALGSTTFGNAAAQAPNLGLSGVSSAPMDNGPGLGLAYSRGGSVNKPITTQKLAKGKMVVPGKAPVKGDSPVNDTVNAKLSPGEIVIPRSIVDGDNAPMEAAKFVAAILTHNRHGIRSPKK